MTASWFAHFAEHAAAAADFVGRSDPSTARRFADAATAARRLSTDLARQERAAQLRVELAEIKAALTARPEIA
jgi:hypothetical protein